MVILDPNAVTNSSKIKNLSIEASIPTQPSGETIGVGFDTGEGSKTQTISEKWSNGDIDFSDIANFKTGIHD